MSIIKNTLETVKKAGQKAVVTIKDSADARNKKSIEKNLTLRIKKYNPLFPEDYTKDSFKLPNIITIVDDAVRRGVDVCEGAIGWLAKENDTEILFLYDEAVNESGLQFVPMVMCDSVYYVDTHDRHTFISVDCYYSRMQEERIAELQNIAYCVGAKSYKVEMVDTTKRYTKIKANAHASAKVSSTSSLEKEDKAVVNSVSLAQATFLGHREPQRPTLLWYAHDGNINNLINICCSGNEQNSISHYNIELSGASTASMSQSMATKVEAVVKSIGASCDFNAKSEEEHSRKVVFSLEF